MKNISESINESLNEAKELKSLKRVETALKKAVKINLGMGMISTVDDIFYAKLMKTSTGGDMTASVELVKSFGGYPQLEYRTGAGQPSVYMFSEVPTADAWWLEHVLKSDSLDNGAKHILQNKFNLI